MFRNCGRALTTSKSTNLWILWTLCSWGWSRMARTKTCRLYMWCWNTLAHLLTKHHCIGFLSFAGCRPFKRYTVSASIACITCGAVILCEVGWLVVYLLIGRSVCSVFDTGLHCRVTVHSPGNFIEWEWPGPAIPSYGGWVFLAVALCMCAT
jgi:hypothetical protein